LLQAGQQAGWVALLLTLTIVVAVAMRIIPQRAIHVIGAGGLLLGILAACSAASWDRGNWLAYHVLLVSWSLLGLTLLLAGWMGDELPLVGPGFWSQERRERAARLLARMFPANSTQRWIEGIAVVLVILALRGGWKDPGKPGWPAGGVLAASVLL